MIVCIDTNTVVQALARNHAYNPILDAWVMGRLTWAVSTEVLLEYEEVITRLASPERWRKLAHLMNLAELTSQNLLRISPSFHFQIVTLDPDDNIFTDCAITASADFLITEDHHFAPLAKAGYKTVPIVPQDFIAKYLAKGY